MIDYRFATGTNLQDDFQTARRQVEEIVRETDPGHDFTNIGRLFALVERAFDGRLPGYQRLQTLYHDHFHTLEVVLCAARLLHGLARSGEKLGAAGIDMALMGALMHDAGYLKREDEVGGSGAQFTAEHVARGAAFAREQLAGLPAPLVAGIENTILITDHRLPANRLTFASEEERIAAYATGTADLIGQMANREYLERLLLLFFEFREAGMGSFTDFHDLLEGTASFYGTTRDRLEGELDDMTLVLAKHYESFEGVATNYYQESIDKNLAYLERVLHEEKARRLDLLKRGGIVDRALKRLQDE
jgi:hypothetical protein